MNTIANPYAKRLSFKWERVVLDCMLLRNSISATFSYSSLKLNSNQSNFSLHSLFYAEACSEITGPISKFLCPGHTSSFEEMSQRWQALGNTVSALTGPRFNLSPPAPETKALPLDQLAGWFKINKLN